VNENRSVEEPILDATAGMDPSDHEWFKKAVFYEVMVRSFRDSNADGIGDLAGLSEKLDYLQWLGVDCLWLPPFFPSPLADGGYDVSNYTDVLPSLGTLEEFREFVIGAHARGIRIITDFVMNHTSDQHPWFQASRNDPDGPYGDFYVWADGVPEGSEDPARTPPHLPGDPAEYADARIIFLDTEASNWTYDEVRGQYFWHRFFHHQPDLNFENPRVLAEIMDAIRFWLELGIDGFRLDAVPYLIEEDGTDCENLPGTHRILKEVRAMIDAEFPGRVLLCEANQWPDDVVEYFGDDDECHMAFHFPVMPRLFMGLRRESRECISDILAATPEIPPGCQWGTFLRNHDELTLEMVTPEDRDYMWAEYAPDPRMVSNLGIRRRLAPLVDGDMRRIHLLHALLLGLPGSPVLYYGDEIGMGDNIWLNDRDGVRTPMQWNAYEGAGFSEAPEEDFYLPLVQDPRYAPAGVNVEQQMLDPGSLLVWLRALLVIRRNHPAFGLGDFTDLGGDNMKVFSFLRSHTDDDGRRVAILCVNNLSPEPQQVALDLSQYAGLVPYDLLRDDDHAMIHTGPFELEVAGHGFLWLRIMADDPALTEPDPAAHSAASVTIEEDNLVPIDPH
jgi:maltose alpha-D-glucosyltransferase/alpha-amylase